MNGIKIDNCDLVELEMVNSEQWMLRVSYLLVVFVVFTPSPSQCSPREVSTNHWYVELGGNGGIEAAKQVASKTGFSLVAPVSMS